MTTFDARRGCFRWVPVRGIEVHGFPAQPAEVTARGRVVRAASPAHVRVLGPLGGPLVGGMTCDPGDLHAQAAALIEAAEWLAAQQDRRPECTGQLSLMEGTER